MQIIYMIFHLHGALLRVLSKVSRVLKGLNTSLFLGLNTYLFLETLKKFLRSQTLKNISIFWFTGHPRKCDML